MAVSERQKMIKERLGAVLGARKMTASDLGQTDNEKKMYQRQILGESLVTVDTLCKVLYMFPEVDANWLMLGEGLRTKTVDRPQIFNNHHTEVHDHGTNTNNYGDAVIPLPVKALLDEKDKRIAELEKFNNQLQGLLAVFTRQAEANAPKKK